VQSADLERVVTFCNRQVLKLIGVHETQSFDQESSFSSETLSLKYINDKMHDPLFSLHQSDEKSSKAKKEPIKFSLHDFIDESKCIKKDAIFEIETSFEEESVFPRVNQSLSPSPASKFFKKKAYVSIRSFAFNSLGTKYFGI